MESFRQGLREAGYRVGDRPTVFSPHLLSRASGGAPQVRDRVYILGVWVGRDRAMTEIDLDPVVPHTVEDGWSVGNCHGSQHGGNFGNV